MGLAALGCDKKEPPGAKEQAAKGAGDSSPVADRPAEKGGSEVREDGAPPAVSAEEVKALVEQWLGAQNRGDFSSYAKLYATKFTGLKRSGERVSLFGHEGWLKDREGMFAKPFAVTAEHVVVTATPELALATFEQSWRSATYQDQGTKRLQVALEGGELRIVREEMLSSTHDAKPGATSVTFEQAAVATKTLASLALLLPDELDANWTIEHPRYVSDTAAERAVSTESLPASLRARLKGRYEVFDAQGKSCEVKARGFRALAKVVPHFGTLQTWAGHPDGAEEKTARVVPPEERALALWQMSAASWAGRGRVLALEMEPNESCGAPVWGREIREGNVAPWAVSALPQELRKPLEAAVSAHSVVQEFDRMAKAESNVSSKGRWLEGLRSDAPRLLKSEGGALFVYAEATGTGGCSYSTPTSVGLLFRLQGQKLTPAGPALYPDTLVLGAVDLNRDGTPELITENGIFVSGPRGHEFVVDHSPLSLDCPC